MARPILVVKVGTSTLLDAHERPVSTFDIVARSICELTDEYRIVLITSGAIGFGVRHLGLAARPHAVAQLQALSMLGQVGLMERWNAAFGARPIGQVLITRHDLTDADERALLTRSIEAMWAYGALPIVNENDAVASDEISFGDNDRLAAELAVRIGAESLVLLTDQDGIQENFGTAGQRRLESARIEQAQRHITAQTSGVGRGGAASKLEAAGIAVAGSVQAYIACARDKNVLRRAMAGTVGTKIVQ